MPDHEHETGLDFATLAIAHKLLNHEQVEKAQAVQVREKSKGIPARSLEEILLEQGVIRREEVWAIYKAQERLLRDARNVGNRIGGYEILEKVGEGGLGVVYRARQLSMGREVALKVLHERWITDDEFRKRFLVEARLVGRLSHQNLIQVIDVGRHKNTLYYSMEFIDGEPIETRIDREGAIPVEECIDLTFQVARALQYLARKKIVHRDVKPGNIMVTRDGVAKLGDFGFVKSSLDSIISPDGEILGTPDYISPEAARGDRDIDFRSDIYSLGASLYHMLAGTPPFGGTASQVMDAHIYEAPPSLRGNDMIPRRVCDLVERMLAKDPDDRFGSYQEMFEEMELLQAESASSGRAGDFELESPIKRKDRLSEVLMREQDLRRQIRILRIVVYVLSGLSALATLVLAYIFLFR